MKGEREGRERKGGEGLAKPRASYACIDPELKRQKGYRVMVKNR